MACGIFSPPFRHGLRNRYTRDYQAAVAAEPPSLAALLQQCHLASQQWVTKSTPRVEKVDLPNGRA